MLLFAQSLMLLVNSFAPRLDAQEVNANEVTQKLKGYVKQLSETIGERNLRHLHALNQTADWIEAKWKEFGYSVERQSFEVNDTDCFNLIVEHKGTELPNEIVLIGAHYDSANGTPGANDNASGTAALLVLSAELKKRPCKRTIRFVAFSNEEPPYFQNKSSMGSSVYARRCRERGENIIVMMSLETMGYYTDEPASQSYPPLLANLYPDQGNFIGFVSNLESREVLTKTLKRFKKNSDIPANGAVLPTELPGVGWSDHWSFWEEGYRGLMVTDTALYRYPHYHEPTDTMDKIDFDRFSKVVQGLIGTIESTANDGIAGNTPKK